MSGTSGAFQDLAWALWQAASALIGLFMSHRLSGILNITPRREAHIRQKQHHAEKCQVFGVAEAEGGAQKKKQVEVREDTLFLYFIIEAMETPWKTCKWGVMSESYWEESLWQLCRLTAVEKHREKERVKPRGRRQVRG